MNTRSEGPVNPAAGTDRNDPSGSGYIIIQLARDRTDDSEDLRQVADTEQFRSLGSFLAARGHLTARRLIRNERPEELRNREQKIADSDFAPKASLTTYWRIDARGVDDAEALRAALADMPEVAIAYHESSVSEACPDAISASANPYFTDQGYLDAAPKGIGARLAWDVPHCDGSGVNAIDLEGGWILEHQDLPNPPLLYGDNGFDTGYVTGDHGAAGLALIGALNNNLGIVGIAPKIARLAAVSHYDAKCDEGLHVADAIDAAVKILARGDILMMPIQRHFDTKAHPVEIDPADLNAILLAVSYGIVVIEAAGNGDVNLDLWTDPKTGRSLNAKAQNGYVDSGAIMVGSGMSAVLDDPGGFKGHRRYDTSNYGSRVNVYAWGENIFTAGYGALAGASGTVDSYTQGFGHTSGAAGIIAGAAALVQSWYRSVHGTSLSSPEMRSKLSDAATSTPQVLVNADPIGVMPDVKAIVSADPAAGPASPGA